MIITYQHFLEEQLLIHKFEGIWSSEKYASYVDIAKKEIDFKNVNKILSDFRELSINEDINNIDTIISLKKEIPAQKLSNVFVVNSPLSTAFLMFYKTLDVSTKFDYQICSTLQKAVLLLNLNKSIIEIEKWIQNLSNKL